MSTFVPNKKPWERPKKVPQMSVFNDSAPGNPTHAADLNTNFVQSTITLENIDQAVHEEFTTRFKVMGNDIKLFIGDAETSSLPMMNFESFDQQKGFLRWPFFVYTRTDSKKLYRTNPMYKRVSYAIPKKKAQGIVFEEYITEGPINWELTYDFTFVTYFREAVNDMEAQINYYFRNKGNMIVYEGQRFTIRPMSQDQICTVDMVNRETADQTTMYVMKFKCKVWCWTRNMDTVQKRERPNSYTIDFSIKNKLNVETNFSQDTIQVERFIVTDKTDPTVQLSSGE